MHLMSVTPRVGPTVKFLQAQWSCAIPFFIPIAFMSLSTHLLHVFLRAPQFIFCNYKYLINKTEADVSDPPETGGHRDTLD